MPNAEVIGMVVGAALTLVIFGYLLGDIPLLGSLFKSAYRLALHLFVGALVGYSFSIVVREVGGKMVMAPLFANSMGIIVVPVMIGLLLFFFKAIAIVPALRRFAYVGNFFLAYLIGVGVAVALVGALRGILVPQVVATGRALSFDSLNLLYLDDWSSLAQGLTIVFGTICTLLAFDFTLAQKRWELTGTLGWIVGALGQIGRWFLIFAFGVAFAGALTASLSIFIGRIQYLIDLVF
jgi:hypothetical protein